MNIIQSSFLKLNSIRIGWYIGLMIVLGTASVSAQVSGAIDSTSIQIGEELRYTISVEADTSEIVTFPEGQTFLPLEVIESYTTDTTYEGERMRLLKTYGLTQFDSGRYLIPKQRILIQDRPFLTDSMWVEVRDVKVDTTKQKMFEIKEAIEVEDPPIDLLAILMWLVPLLLVLAIIGLLLFRRKKRKQAAAKPLPPYEEAITALKELDNSELLIHHRSKEYYSTLTEIVKRYLDREIDDTALESTSDELIARLQLHKDAGHFDLDSETIKHLDEVLKRADLVKFAKMQQGQDQARSDRNTIEEIINHTHEIVPEPTEEELQENEKYLESKRKRRQSRKVLWSVVSVVVALVITCAVFMSIYGVTYVKDTIFGHPTKELLEQRWYKSEYGNPAIVVETPEILMRNEASIPEEMQSQVRSISSFDYGNLWDHFYMQIGT
ncbi:MAG: DUF4381 domain-containing protein, partial [Flavobacteriaceae bacterium]|nr:DUF4381 domain-containing protein [Flavobacteriaceae bacterium]